MKCPSCNAVLSAPAPQCPRCKVSMRQLDIKFGLVPQHTRFLTDHTGQLPKRELTKLHGILRLFSRKFPQAVFSVFLTNQIPKGATGEYAFWLANRVRFSPMDAVGGDNFDLLLTIDTQANSAVLVVGYGLEHYLNERDLERALAEAASGFHAGDFGGGIRACVDLMMNRLQEIAQDIEEREFAQQSIVTSEPS